jgi:hypothetical protein
MTFANHPAGARADRKGAPLFAGRLRIAFQNQGGNVVA